MPRLALLLLCSAALACGKVSRPVGLYTPELSSAGAAGVAGAATDSQDSPPDLSQPWPSSGCGKPLPQRKVVDGYSSWQVEQTGETLSGHDPARQNLRSFYVRAPSDYDSSRPYRVVYLLRGGCDMILLHRTADLSGLAISMPSVQCGDIGIGEDRVLGELRLQPVDDRLPVAVEHPERQT